MFSDSSPFPTVAQEPEPWLLQGEIDKTPPGERKTPKPPSMEGDPWKVGLKNLLEVDEDRCKQWVQEVQHLLVFAGLFSAVVTAFLVEIQKELRPSDSDIVLMMLVESISNATGAMAPRMEFEPSIADITVATLWFLSLVFSLSFVLISLLVWEWVREHQRRPTDMKDAFLLLNMQMESLERWWVPQIIGILPFVLQASLILFFIGILVFLWDMNSTVTVIISAAIGTTLSFFAITMIAPLAQELSIHFSPSRFLPSFLRYAWVERLLERNDSPPVPCPYKSFPSRQLLRSGLAMKKIATELAARFASYRGRQAIRLDCDNSEDSQLTDDTLKLALSIAVDWFPHGKRWLVRRDRATLGISATLKGNKELAAGMYDGLHGLGIWRAHTRSNAWNETSTRALSLCLWDVIKNKQDYTDDGPEFDIRLAQELYGESFDLERFTASFEEKSEFIALANWVVFCGGFGTDTVMQSYLHDRVARLLRMLYDAGSWPDRDDPEWLWCDRLVADLENRTGTEHTPVQTILLDTLFLYANRGFFAKESTWLLKLVNLLCEQLMRSEAGRDALETICWRRISHLNTAMQRYELNYDEPSRFMTEHLIDCFSIYMSARSKLPRWKRSEGLSSFRLHDIIQQTLEVFKSSFDSLSIVPWSHKLQSSRGQGLKFIADIDSWMADSRFQRVGIDLEQITMLFSQVEEAMPAVVALPSYSFKISEGDIFVAMSNYAIDTFTNDGSFEAVTTKFESLKQCREFQFTLEEWRRNHQTA